VDQIAEIVVEAGESTNFRSHDISTNRMSDDALFGHDLFGKPATAVPDHALTRLIWAGNMALTLMRQCKFPQPAQNSGVLG
jgi:hypothetical protein